MFKRNFGKRKKRKKKKVVKKKKPSAALKRLCKKLGVRLTVKRGKKRMYKSEKVLKKQCKNKMKKKKKVKRKRKFGARVVSEAKYLPERVEDRIVDFLAPTQEMVSERKRRVINELIPVLYLEDVFSPDSNYRLVSDTDLVPDKRYKFTILGTNFQQGLQGMAPSIKQGKYIGHRGDTDIIIQFDGGVQLIPTNTILEVHELNNVEVNLTGGTNTHLQSPQMQMMYHVLQIMNENPATTFPEAQQQYMISIGMGPRGPPPRGPPPRGPPPRGPPHRGPPPRGPPHRGPGFNGPEYRPFGKRKKKVSAALKRLCKKHKVRLTVKRGKKRMYKSDKVLKRQCKNAMKKKK